MNRDQFVTVGELGRLRIVRVLDEYDGPKLLAVSDDAGQLYIAYWLGRDHTGEQWMFLPTTDTKYSALIRGHLDFRSLLTTPKFGSIAMVAFSAAGNIQLNWQLASSIDASYFPSTHILIQHPEELSGVDAALIPADEFLQDVEERIQLVDTIELVRSSALASGRDRISARLSKTKHEVGSRFLANFVRELQTIVDGMVGVQVGADETALNVMASRAASFDLEMVAAYPGSGLFADTGVSRGLEKLFALMQLRADEPALKAALHVLPKRSASRYLRFMQAVSEARADVVIVWGSPSLTVKRPVSVAALPRPIQSSVVTILEQVESKEAGPFTYEGILFGALTEGKRFELRTQAGLLTGVVMPEAFDSARHATLGKRYKASIRHAIDTNLTTGKEKLELQLVGLERVPDEKG